MKSGDWAILITIATVIFLFAVAVIAGLIVSYRRGHSAGYRGQHR